MKYEVKAYQNGKLRKILGITESLNYAKALEGVFTNMYKKFDKDNKCKMGVIVKIEEVE